MSVNLSISGVSERDVDLLLLEEFTASPEFGTWFVSRTIGPSADLGACIYAQRSVTDSTGESDLEVTFCNREERHTRFLIENKVGAGLQPRQAERYRLRGSDYVSRGVCDKYCCVIVAPSRYFGHSGGTKGFDHRLAYESILEWFSVAADLGARRHYKAALLRAAIQKGTLGYQPEEDAAATTFWRDYWSFSCQHAPELEMREPGAKPSGSTFVAFHPPELPRGIELVHKMTHGFVDLQVSGAASRLNGLRARLEPLLTDGMYIAKAGKSAAVRIRTPQLNLGAEAGSQEVALGSGIKAALRLLQWFCAHSDAVADFTAGVQPLRIESTK